MNTTIESPGLPFDGKSTYILPIQDGCNKSRSGDAVPEQIFGTGMRSVMVSMDGDVVLVAPLFNREGAFGLFFDECGPFGQLCVVDLG